jgi:hypothetical protein
MSGFFFSQGFFMRFFSWLSLSSSHAARSINDGPHVGGVALAHQQLGTRPFAVLFRTGSVAASPALRIQRQKRLCRPVRANDNLAPAPHTYKARNSRQSVATPQGSKVSQPPPSRVPEAFLPRTSQGIAATKIKWERIGSPGR